jgi:cytoskeletal protein RodZ
MATVAEQLRQAREARNYTIEQMAEITKIRGDHLRALEEGNFDVFIAPVYIRGFVRTYAGLLRLDVPRVMTTLDQELGQTKKFAEPPPLTEHPRGPVDFVMLQLSQLDWRKGLSGLVLILVIVGAVGGYFWWRHRTTHDPLSDLKPGIYRPPQAGSNETLPLPPAAPRR